MDPYKSYLENAGVTGDPYSKFPKTAEYFAYLNGESFGPFATREEAKAISRNTETVYRESPERVAAINEHEEKTKIATDKYHSDLRAEFSHLPESIYQICHAKAYEDGHAYGYDEVTIHLYDCAEFAEAIIKAHTELKS